MIFESYLEISGVGFPKFSCREASQSLEPVKSGDFLRTVNGGLRYLGLPGHQKYQSQIICHDRNLPSLCKAWSGEVLTVHCLSHIGEEVSLGAQEKEVSLQRACVRESLSVECENGKSVSHRMSGNTKVVLGAGSGKAFVRYRPILKMYLRYFHLAENEWENSSKWRLHLEEI